MGGRIRHLIRRGRAKIRRVLKRLRNRLFMFKRISHKEIGDSNDRAYELWTSDTETGTVSMTVKRDGRYKCKGLMCRMCFSEQDIDLEVSAHMK